MHHGLLQHLVQMPHLTDIEVQYLELIDQERHPAVQSHGCVWQNLTVNGLPSVSLINSFSAWPALRKLKFNSFGWDSGWPLTSNQAAAMKSAIIRIVSGYPILEGRLCRLPFYTRKFPFPGAIPIIELIEILCPLFSFDSGLDRINVSGCHLSCDLLLLISDRMPRVSRLEVDIENLSEGAWKQMLCMHQIKCFHFGRVTPLALMRVGSFASIVPFSTEIAIDLSFLEGNDREAFKSINLLINASRRLSRLPPIILSDSCW